MITFDQLLSHGKLTQNEIDLLARKVANLYLTASPLIKNKQIAAEFKLINEHLNYFYVNSQNIITIKLISKLKNWLKKQRPLITPLIASRYQAGLMHNGYGLLNINNIALCNNQITFLNDNRNYTSDLINEVARLIIELTEYHALDLASRFITIYLEESGDYSGLALLRFYQINYLIIRAQESLMAFNHHCQLSELNVAQIKYQNDLRLALNYTKPAARRLIITHGLSGAGKTTITNQLLARLGAIRIRADVERKRLFGLAPLARSASKPFAGIYSSNANRRTYQRIEELAANLLAMNFPVIVEATFLRKTGREAFRALAKRTAAIFVILDFYATPTTLRARLIERQERGTDASEAGVTVLEHQLVTAEPLTNEELTNTIKINTETVLDIDALITQLLMRKK